MDVASGEDVAKIKQSLIASNPVKILTQDDVAKHAIIPRFIDDFEVLVAALKATSRDTKSNTASATDKYRTLVVDCLSIWFSRTAQLLQAKLFTTHRDEFSQTLRTRVLSTANCDFFFKYIIDFWIDGNPPLISALKSLFDKFLGLLKIVQGSKDICFMLNKWSDEILKVPSTLKVQYYLIEVLSLEVNMHHILERQPNFIAKSFQLFKTDSLANPIGKCLVNLLINVYKIHFGEDRAKIPHWVQIWIEPLRKSVNMANPATANLIKLYFLAPLLKHTPSEVFIQLFQNVNLSKDDPSLLLLVLRIGEELSIEEEPFHNDRLIPMDTVAELLDVDEFKLAAFELLTYSSKKSKPIQPTVFDVIIEHLTIFFIDSNIESANSFSSTFKKFVLRIRDSAYGLNRTMIKLNKANKFPEEQEQIKLQLQNYQNFLKRLLRLLKRNIIPGVQYQESLLSLDIVQYLISIGLDSNIPAEFVDKQNPIVWPFRMDIITDVTLLQLLLDNLVNRFSDIRQVSKTLLFAANKCETSKKVLDELVDVTSLMARTKQNLPKYQDSETNASLNSFLFGISLDKIKCIEDRVHELRIENQRVKKDPIARSKNVISGHCTVLALYLDALDSEDIPKVVLDPILEQVSAAWEIVKGIMCYDASDSLLPAEYLGSGISDQTVLTYSFKTVKESCALLDVLLTRYPLSDSQLEPLGEHLISQLLNIRHSGAFQAVLPTFKIFCYKCRERIPKRLTNWLDEILKTLETKTQHITRRSGGLPFLVTSIIVTETDKKRPELKTVFDKLLSIISNASEINHQDKLDLPAVNAFNCIKAIFIESKLSHACTAYFPIGLEWSLKYFSSDIWALRNCSLMLFTSLQNRIFGKTGNNIGARLFFTRYNGIKGTLLSILDQSTKTQTDVESTFLVLNLLLRLNQTPGYDGLDVFIPPVTHCLKDVNWKIRELAAKVLASFVDQSHGICINIITNVSLTDQNKLHGHLQVIAHLLGKQMYSSELIPFILSSAHQFVTLNPCYVTVKAYLKNVDTIFKEYRADVTDSQYTEIVAIFGNYFLKKSEKYCIDGSKQLCLAQVASFLLRNEKSQNKMPLCEIALECPFYEVQNAAINYVIEVWDTESLKGTELIGICASLQSLLHSPEVLISLKGNVMKALQKCGQNFGMRDLMQTLKTPRAESYILYAITLLGECVKTYQDARLMLEFLQPYLCDEASESYRSATLTSLINCSKNIKVPQVLLEIHNFLSDDDIDLRETAAAYLNRDVMMLSNWHIAQNFMVTSERFCRQYVGLFREEEVRAYITERIIKFFEKNDIFASKKNFEGLFDVEKDNQYRNDIQQNFQYLDMLKEIDLGSDSSLRTYATSYCTKVIRHISGLQLQDNLSGWTADIDVFSRIVVLRTLLDQENELSELQVLDTVLKEYNAHPLIFEY
ncbi:tRNA methylation protein TRM732 KNAG_0J00440 [Huiozyma naganishii CBS 8797]|uniref:Uncharacterized protein n=1 Tax=Huiozyma naganishii (strain ATCC MYA-139 / BCRC 22969 / CBS 8797 / KCTC 17520 / NBRC 10181 / NCYC 3082 / Yp74L-3) TaxID=1071383 RepID=J7S2M8_HUIN7|nr:hypothetical protein KNAG_0J00440 [Kazachstania naganishii CBS 8797]CCK72127.1 hypothetical protein KNAG_0J00440 [Kazachstania naganishii CBS 8797]